MGKPALELTKLPEWATSFSGSGSGDGYGYGDGSGDGDGDGDGYGYGYGDGSGDGDGDGYGYGYGDGDGDGYGDGYGDGDGDGYGYGYGSGYGDGYGSGSGDGSGYGYGYGYGYGDGYGYGYEKARSIYFAALLAPYKRGEDRQFLFWRSSTDGSPANGGRTKEKARVGLTEEAEGPLELCTHRALHGTLDPTKWKGERWWVVALHEPVVTDGDKAGSLKRTIVADLGKCPFLK
jgi:hypothetical protein